MLHANLYRGKVASHHLSSAPLLPVRFKERCGIDLDGQKLIDRFFRDNASYVYSLNETRIRKDDGEYLQTEVFGSTIDGVAMGVTTECGNILFRTFVTYQMLKGEQVEQYTRNEEIRKEIHGR